MASRTEKLSEQTEKRTHGKREDSPDLNSAFQMHADNLFDFSWFFYLGEWRNSNKETINLFFLLKKTKHLASHYNHKKKCQHCKRWNISSVALHLSSTLPVRTGSSNTRRKSFPGLESAGEIRTVRAHQRASGSISRWENRRPLSLTAHVGKRNRGHAGPCAADLHAGPTAGLDIENVPRVQKKIADKWLAETFPVSCWFSAAFYFYLFFIF